MNKNELWKKWKNVLLAIAVGVAGAHGINIAVDSEQVSVDKPGAFHCILEYGCVYEMQDGATIIIGEDLTLETPEAEPAPEKTGLFKKLKG